MALVALVAPGVALLEAYLTSRQPFPMVPAISDTMSRPSCWTNSDGREAKYDFVWF
jgi:hypothetical protein